MKKCLVLDLDNTLWGGIAGEDGIDNIALSLSPPGNSFIAFQQAVLDHYNRGVILAINSKNNPEDAWNIIRNHPNMILKENHFAAHRINWEDKVENMKSLAKELNIGLDSFVFLDDDPTNRAQVRSMIPEVAVPELPLNPSEYVRFINSLDYFNSEVITDEDKMRGNLYVTERLRKEEEKKFDNKEDFLKDMGLELYTYKNNDSCVSRLSQLTEKTNQFNTIKNPFSEKEIHKFIKDEKYEVYHARLSDKFGDHGVILFALVKKNKSDWVIKSLLMSCRVFGRGVEEAFLAGLSDSAKKEDVKKIKIEFEETDKNQPALDFVNKYFTKGFYNVASDLKSPKWMKIYL